MLSVLIAKHPNSVQKRESKSCGNGSENRPTLAPGKRRTLEDDWLEQSPFWTTRVTWRR